MWILAKELVGKRFFDLFAFYIDKVISSLARVLEKVLGIGFFFIWFEVRFFNFTMNKANCDWLTLILNMAHLYQKQNHKQPCSFCLKESEGPGGVRRLHKYLWYFRQHFPNIGYWEYASCASNTMLGNSIEKKWKWYRQHCQKVNSLGSIHFQLCSKYIICCFTMLCHPILGLAMGSNFHVVHPCQP